jgi:hypothetical protein
MHGNAGVPAERQASSEGELEQMCRCTAQSQLNLHRQQLRSSRVSIQHSLKTENVRVLAVGWLQVEKTTRNALDVLDLIGLHDIGAPAPAAAQAPAAAAKKSSSSSSKQRREQAALVRRTK